MTPVCWPEWMDDIWAKSADKGAGGKPESLAQHTWYVLTRLSEFIYLRPELPQRLTLPRLWHVLYWAAFLHDFGKAAYGFQARLRGGDRWPYRHEVLSLAFVDWICAEFSPEERLWLVAAIVSHHKDASEIERLYAEPDEFEEDLLREQIGALDTKTVQSLWRWLNECGGSWIAELGLENAGVINIATTDYDSAVASIVEHGADRIYYWLRQYRRFTRALRKPNNPTQIVSLLALRGYIINADHSASAHAGELPSVDVDATSILHSRKLAVDDLFEHQRVAGATEGSVLLTAPTGSGKTEAALLWAAHQSHIAGKVPRLFYTLPYQASMNAMKLRLGDTFGEEKVGLQHGRSLLVLYSFLQDRKYEPRDAVREARWMRNLMQLNYPPIRVFSPYQMLKGMYRLKGYEAVLSDYHDATFIFDEIHAYEVNRLALILKTIEYLRQNFNAQFFIMSATFPSLIKEWLTQVLDHPVQIHAHPSLFEKFQRHRLHLLKGELLSEEGINQIMRDAMAGKSILIVCNLVDRAQAIYAELHDRLNTSDIPIELLHGRFNIRDRSTKEATVRHATGSTRNERQPFILIATQVVEVSLDIDLDTIYTDPAPLEALVQRFGRINRRCKLADLAPVYVFQEPNDGQKIYDAELVQRTLKILRREDGRPLNEGAVGNWLDEIYSGEIAQRWQEDFTIAAKEFEDICIHTLRPFESDPLLEDAFYQAFDGMEVLPASQYDEYQNLKKYDPIRANELLVPISIGRFHALCNDGKVWPRENRDPFVVEAAYNSEIGLQFE